MDLVIVPPPGYCKTRMRWLWARVTCACRGDGEIIVYDDDSDLPYPQPCDCLWSPDADTIRTSEAARDAELRAKRARLEAVDQWQSLCAQIGPRYGGLRYWSGRHQQFHTVATINVVVPGGDPARATWSMTERSDNGNRVTHSAPWDPALGDGQAPLVLRRPPSPAPIPPELRSRCEPGCYCHSRFAIVRLASRTGVAYIRWGRPPGGSADVAP